MESQLTRRPPLVTGVSSAGPEDHANPVVQTLFVFHSFVFRFMPSGAVAQVPLHLIVSDFPRALLFVFLFSQLLSRLLLIKIGSISVLPPHSIEHASSTF